MAHRRPVLNTEKLTAACRDLRRATGLALYRGDRMRAVVPTKSPPRRPIVSHPLITRPPTPEQTSGL